MKPTILMLTATALTLAVSTGQVQAQQSSEGQMMQHGQQGRMMQQDQQSGSMQQGMPGMPGMMGQGMMGRGMTGRGMMGQGMMGQGGGHMGHGAMMPILFAIMDANGDKALTLEEVQQIHARIFAHMDADDDGKLVPEEIKDFFHGGEDSYDSDE